MAKLSSLEKNLKIILIKHINRVMIVAMLAWVCRFFFFAIGDPGMPGVFLFALSMLVYGVAFDFFNISGSLFVNNEVPENMRSSAQGLFMLMTNGLGASIGIVAAQEVVNYFTKNQTFFDGWPIVWYIFAGYALLIAILFAFIFKDKKV